MLIIWFANGGGGSGETQLGDDIIGTVLLNMAVFGAMLSYIVQALSFIILRRNLPNIERPFRSPLGIPWRRGDDRHRAGDAVLPVAGPELLQGRDLGDRLVRGRGDLFRAGRPQQAHPLARGRVRDGASDASDPSGPREQRRSRPFQLQRQSPGSSVMASSAYSLDQLKADVKAGTIDTVRRRVPRHAGPADRQALPGGILPRRRDRRDAWLRLPAGQRHRHGAGARLRGGQLGQGLWRLRHEARHHDADASGVARGHGDRARRPGRPSPPRADSALAARDAEGTAGAARQARADGEFRLRARILPVRRDIPLRLGQGLPGPRARPATTSRTTTSSRPPRKRG